MSEFSLEGGGMAMLLVGGIWMLVGALTSSDWSFMVGAVLASLAIIVVGFTSDVGNEREQ